MRKEKREKEKKELKVGLALGSGGAKGLSHIGVIEVLEKNGIPIDFIAGSSIGALIGGFYAATRDIKKVEKRALGIDWKKLLSLIDPSLRQGLIGGTKIKNSIEEYLGKKKFRDSKIPFAAIATDLKTGEAVPLDKGEIASAIRASISIPLIFKPVKLNGRLLADGGLSLPIPVSVVRKMGAEIVIAVSLDDDYFNNRGRDGDKLGFYRIAYDSIDILRYHLARCSVAGADFTIFPKVGWVKWDDFLEGEKIISIGKKAAKETLPQLKKLIKSEEE